MHAPRDGSRPWPSPPRSRRLVRAVALAAIALFVGPQCDDDSCGPGDPEELTVSVDFPDTSATTVGQRIPVVMTVAGGGEDCDPTMEFDSLADEFVIVEQATVDGEHRALVEGSTVGNFQLLAYAECADGETSASLWSSVVVNPCSEIGDTCSVPEVCCCGLICDPATNTCLADMLDGTWDYTIDQIEAYGDCEGDEVDGPDDPETYRIHITQTGCELLSAGWIHDPAVKMFGRARGTTVVFSGEYPEEQGETTTTHTLDFVSATRMEGIEEWSWKHAQFGLSCPDGLAETFAVRIP